MESRAGRYAAVRPLTYHHLRQCCFISVMSNDQLWAFSAPCPNSVELQPLCKVSLPSMQYYMGHVTWHTISHFQLNTCTSCLNRLRMGQRPAAQVAGAILKVREEMEVSHFTRGTKNYKIVIIIKKKKILSAFLL